MSTSTPDTAPQHPSLAGLDPSVVAALAAAAGALERLTGNGGLLGEVRGVKEVLAQLAQSASLRQLTARTLANGASLSDSAERLLSADPAAATSAANEVRAQVDGAVRDAAQARRRERRAAKSASVDQVQLDRMRRERDSAREDRNAARRKAEYATREAADLRQQLAETTTALADAQRQAEDAARHLSGLRERHEDLTWLAGALHTTIGRLSRQREERDTTAQRLLEPLGAQLEPLQAALRTLTSAPATTRDLDLRVEMLGGVDIGGSCVLVTAGDDAVLVDCGAGPGAENGPPHLDRIGRRRLTGVVITHAHNDHAGFVPALVARHPGLGVFATPATVDLLATMWRDSAKVLARRPSPAYGNREVDRAVDALTEIGFGSTLRLGDLEIELFPAGHIVGAASVVVRAGERRVVVSGDVSTSRQATVDGFAPSSLAQAPDLLVLESTYGADLAQQPRAEAVSAFVSTAREVTDAGGVLLVPAFALGRAQEVALLCQEMLPGVPVLIDGLAREVSEVYERHLPEGRRVFGGAVRSVARGGTAEAVKTFRGGVVISTSGMLHQGPVLSWARRVLDDPRSGLAVVGYQDAESPGRRLLRLAEAGGGYFELPGRDGGDPEKVEVRASVTKFGLGAHANATQLSQIVQRLQPSGLMLVHGEERARSMLGNRLRSMGHHLLTETSW
ncbi:MBL fold metallo-hydrolase [Nocardioides sp. GY 10113]|uniref:MBL fold metallo-hydrolase n=1 Tax=Nocardioides sp. GY 10113 TaxID=2569761 RepID=UPI0010A88084|nr:MBL fold metallo-hydrolase [Nocardioides sp. GY 10113]TIC86701.1 MBL fold metallo-hydrolase [Nocardioides sp. GY 10113]